MGQHISQQYYLSRRYMKPCLRCTQDILHSRDYHRAILKSEYLLRFNISVSSGIVGDIFVGPYLLLAGWLLNDIVRFLKLFYWAVWRCASTWEAEVVVSARRSSSTQWGRSPTQAERDISRKFDWTWDEPTAWPPRSPYLTPMNFFRVGTFEGARVLSHSQHWRRFRGKACENGNVNMLRRVRFQVLTAASMMFRTC
jgi:hypothetical protein